MPEDETIEILVVDDKRENLLFIEGVLDRPGLSIIPATSGKQALELVHSHHVALILLDVQMPEMDGFEVAERIRDNEDLRHIPIIFATAHNKEDPHVFTGYEKGAVDYLFKPLDPLILRSKVNVFVELFQQRKSLQKNNEELQKVVAELKHVNQQMREQQKSIIEEERLKVLLQMAGATAHELNQPLMVLMGNIQLLEMDEEIPPAMAERFQRISQAADRIADIVKKIQTLRHDEQRQYIGGKTILNLNQPVSILCIEGQDSDFGRLQKALSSQPELRLSRAKRIDEALDMLEKKHFDLLFLEYLLPDGNGLAFLDTLNSKRTDIPTVVITGQGDEMIASRMIQAGASDYLPKSKISSKSLLRTISNALEKARLKKEMRIAQEKLTEMSIRDELTGMFNRRYFKEALERELSGAKRYKHRLALGFIDLDHFKRVNDTHGHLCGDHVLKEFGKLLKESIRMYDVACRYGGEEFAVLLPDTSLDEAESLFNRFRERIGKHIFAHNDIPVRITASVGLTAYSGKEETTAQQLLDLVDKALYQAKDQGRDKVVAI